MKVRDWMNAQVEACEPSADLSCAAMIMWRRDCGFVPVVNQETGKLAGVVTDRDICMAVATRRRAPEVLTAEDVMSSPVYACKPDDDVATALGTMRKRQVRRLPVLGDDGRLVGVLAFADVIRHGGKATARVQHAITPQELLDALREIEKPRRPVVSAAVAVAPSIMAEAIQH